MSRRRRPDWTGYLDAFHGEAAGITEDLLAPARDEAGRSPYAWLLDGLGGGEGDGGDGAPVVDLGCGSAPTGAEGRAWVGIDRSIAELQASAARGRAPVVLADSAQLPVADGSASAVLSAMSLMVVGDPAGTLTEARRALAPGRTLLVLLPARAPMTVRDRLRMGAIMAVAGVAGFPFPHREVLRHPASWIADAGFRVEADQARRFAVPLPGPDDGERFVRSLYLPDVAAWRVRLARRVARRWRGELGIPLRRIVARRPPAPPSGGRESWTLRAGSPPMSTSAGHAT